MGYIVLAYAEEGYQECILPDLYDADYDLVLNRQLFGMSDDLHIALENVDDKWRFVSRKHYRLRNYEGENAFGCVLEDGQVYYLKSRDGSKLTLVILCCEDAFPAFEKYELSQTGQITIGKDEESVISYDFRGYISKNHCILFKYGSQWVFQDFSSNGSYLNGKRVRQQVILKFGDRITLFGLKIIFLDSYVAVCTLSGKCRICKERLQKFYPRENLDFPEIEETQEKEFFKRSPRTIDALYKEEIEIEAPPQLNKAKKRPLLLTIGPSFTMAIPMFMGCMMSIISAKSRGVNSGIYMFTGLVTAISSAIIGVIWALVNMRYASQEEEENEELRYNAYGQYLIDITEFIKQKHDENRNILFRTYHSGQECCEFNRLDMRLWNKNERQQDFMTVRLGKGTIPFQAPIRIPKEKFSLIKDDLVSKPAMIQKNYEMMNDVPVCLDIRDKGVIGVIGGYGKYGAYSVVHNMIVQLAANNCYTDVKMVFLFGKSREAKSNWSFTKWLPHVWTEDRKVRMVANEKSEVGDILYELSRVFRIRTEEQNNKHEYPLPHYVFFIDDIKLLEGELLEQLILDPKPEYGITTVLLAEKYEDLPNTCENIIQNDGRESRFFHVFNSEQHTKDLVFETVGLGQLENLSRRLCDIEVKEVQGNGEIPASVDFFKMYGVDTMEQLGVLERWKKNRNYENMRVPIGQKSGGSLCYLDIHEKYHGPHGLIAGTTGSGKSETLQTYILSLAVNFSPDDIAFFVIDFKGGGMANLFSNLPHMVGQISNLSGNQVRRAMISIKSENMRRQKLFAEYNVNNINLYTRLYKSHETKIPIPHLFIVIDEFAELKREEPEFMKELISVAQVGRSLGVHLILATQKPSGTVDDNIWSNSKFRLCLRVQDKQDSNDMLHKPDAAYITQTGRGFLQVGNDEIYEQFQSGYSGADYVEDAKNRAASAVMMTLNGKADLIGSGNRKRKSAAQKSKTQLDAVVEYLRIMAHKHHYEQSMLLWLPVLPTELYLADLHGYQENLYRDGKWPIHTGKWHMETMIGLYDDPAHQAQEPFRISFSEGGHLAVCGTIATGKSTFLQTFLYAMINQYSPEELNFYALDYSSRMLLSYEQAPHCGGVIVDTDADKVKKFFFMLDGIMKERKQLFRGGNYSQYVQSDKGKEKVPAILVVIDNYANFREKTNSQFDEDIIRISREGVSYGIFLVVSSGGFGSSEIPSRVADNIRTVVSLEMGDKFKYAEVLRTTRTEVLPEADVKGRGLASINGTILEFQTALAIPAEDAYARSEKIEKECIEMQNEWKGESAKKIPVIPANPTLQLLTEREKYQKLLTQRRYLPFAYQAQDASVYSVDLWRTYCYLVQGRSRSGKKNTLKLLMYAASKKENARVCLIDLKGQEFKKTAEQLSVEYLTEETQVFEFFKSTIPEFKARNLKKNSYLAEGIEEDELAEKMSSETQIYIFIADMVSFIQSAYRPMEGVGSMNAYLENITEKGSYHGFYFFGILNPEQVTSIAGYKLYMNMISYKTGVHLGGNTAAQRLFQFTNIPFQEQSKTAKPGTGLTPLYDEPGIAESIVLPLIKGDFT